MARAPLTRAFLFAEELRKLDPELPVQHAAAFLMVAREEGITQVQAAERLGISKSAIQRAFDKLSDKGSLGKEGFGLIEIREGVEDKRNREAYLTAKGKRFLNSIVHLMER